MTTLDEAAQALDEGLDGGQEQRMVNLIAPLHRVRAEKAAATKTDKEISDVLKPYVRKLPGRELWDMEHEPPLGVGVKDGGGNRWLNFEPCSDAEIIAAARAGLLSLNVGAYDGALKSSDLRLGDAARQLSPHVKPGAGESFEMLTDTGALR